MGADERRHDPSTRRYSIAAHRGMAVGGLRKTDLLRPGRCCCSVLEGLRSEQTDNRSTNKAVAGWLEDKGVLPRNAKSIATILRAKGLPTGPRKKKSPRTQ